MNFKKSSIFRRGAEDEPEQEPVSGGILAVWGSPGSGKSITAVKLAKALADRKKNVVLLLCDMTAPMDQLEYLLRFEKPLALVCEQWQDAQNVDYSADFSRILTDISEGDLEQDYPLMPDCPSPERGQTMERRLRTNQNGGQ